MKIHRLKNLFAFTLAEVLITLGIIGVVAAMTIPTLTAKIQNHQCEVATAKFYSQITQALKHYMADNDVEDLRDSKLADSEWCGGEGYTEAEATEEFGNFIKTYLKAHEYDKDHIFDNFSKTYRSLSGESGQFKGSWKKRTTYKTINGVAIYPNFITKACYPGDIIVDINGKIGPNIGGRDLWALSIYYDGTIGESGMTPGIHKNVKENMYMQFYNKCLSGLGVEYGAGCFGRFKLNNFKFDY